MSQQQEHSSGSGTTDPYHIPVMVEEVLELLDVRPGHTYLDGTLGGGGHTAAMLDAGASVIAIDRDPQAIAHAEARFGELAAGRLEVRQGNYGDLQAILEGSFPDRLPLAGALIDAGVSSHQLDTASRGFSFMRSGPLDMRMGPDAPTVAEYLDGVDAEELARVFRDYGEFRGAGRMARAILSDRQQGRLETTEDLRELSARVLGSSRSQRIHPATQVFQALRIAVNRELEHLERALEALPEVLRPGGRAVVISFHSLEDRLVKQAFRRLSRGEAARLPAGLPVAASDLAGPRAKLLTRKPITPTNEEVEANPRARSARARAVEMLDPGGG